MYFFWFCACNLFQLERQLKTSSANMEQTWSKRNSKKFPLQNLQQRLLKPLFRRVLEVLELWPQSSSNVLSLSRSSEINPTHHLAGKSSRLRLWRGNETLTKCFLRKYNSMDICPVLIRKAQIYPVNLFATYEEYACPSCKVSSKPVDSWQLKKKNKSHSKRVGWFP